MGELQFTEVRGESPDLRAREDVNLPESEDGFECLSLNDFCEVGTVITCTSYSRKMRSVVSAIIFGIVMGVFGGYIFSIVL